MQHCAATTKGVTIFGSYIFIEGEKGGGETAWLHGSHIICLSASLFLSASCVLAKERESTNQSVPTTQRCGYVIFNHKAEQSSTAWNVERQQPTTSSNTHSQKRSFSSGSCFINSRLDFFFSFFLISLFFSDPSYVLYVVVFFKSCELLWKSTIQFTSAPYP